MPTGTKVKIAALKRATVEHQKAIKKLAEGLDESRLSISKLIALAIILEEKGIVNGTEIQEKLDSLSNGNPKDSEGSSVQSEGSRSDADSGGSTGSDVLPESGDSADSGSVGDSEPSSGSTG